MSTVLSNQTDTTDQDRVSSQQVTSANELRHNFRAMRLAFCWLGMRKSLSGDQRQQVAEPFGAEQNFISAGKKLIDTGHPAVRSVNQLRRRVVDYWRNSSLPYPEPGLRLVRQQDVAEMAERMQRFREELNEAVQELEASYQEIKQQARQRLGSLYAETDYPSSLVDSFGLTWEFPNVEPPDYLQQLEPKLYEQECRRVRQRFQEAVQLAEQAFVEELSGLVSHLAERLSGADDGRPKVFRDSALSNLREFFDRFSRLNISSSGEIDGLVQRAESILSGLEPGVLRVNDSLRQQVASQLSGVQSLLDGLMIDRPRRRIMRD
jgi:hypothetical protein